MAANKARLREALSEIVAMVAEYKKNPGVDGEFASGYLEDIASTAKEALDEPQRNCERYDSGGRGIPRLGGLPMKCEVEHLDWTTVYAYTPDGESSRIELTLPLEEMQEICQRYDLEPILGAGEASFPAFSEWLYRHKRTYEQFYGHQTGFDVSSLVDLFHEDLVNLGKLKEREKKQ